MTVREQIDMELKNVYVNETLKKSIMKKTYRKPAKRYTGAIAAAMAIVILGGTTAYAGRFIYSNISVNKETMPELDRVYRIEANKLDWPTDEYGKINGSFDNYKDIQRELGVDLLDSEVANDDSCLKGKVSADNDYAILTLDNYISEDTENGYSSVSMEVHIILSEKQEKQGWNIDFLGYYEYKESFISAQGYKVNLVEATVEGPVSEDFVSKKSAYFVADGVLYSLTGKISTERMKAIIDSMK